MKTRYLRIGIWALLAGMLWYCANPGTPTGGPKDEKPPRVVKSTPAPNALEFQGKTIQIEFDEFIQLKDIFQKFVISPPVNKRPIIDARGKQLHITFDEELQPSTTYTLDFADAIADYNEGNVIPNFTFSFSTGESSDSMVVAGHLFDAADHSPADGIMVLLHKNEQDSAFRTLVPNRVAKTDTKGRFTVQNVAPGSYRLYALDDMNRDYKFNQPGEKIAFLKELIAPGTTLRNVTDSIAPDSTHTYQKLFYTPDSLKLFLFQETSTDQYLKGEERKQENKLSFFFNLPLAKPYLFQLTPNPLPNQPYVLERSAKSDTLTLWITDSVYYRNDSLRVILNFPALDSLKNTIVKADTTTMWFFKKEEKKRRRKDDEPEPIPSLAVQIPSTIDLFNPLPIVLPTPAKYADQAALRLLRKQDTLWVEHPFSFEQDSLNIRRYRIRHSWEAGASYQLELDSAAFVDYYGLANASAKISFSIRKLDTYGTLYFNVKQPRANQLLQILGRNEEVVRQGYIPENGKIAFRYIKAGEYFVKILTDSNRNGQWDTGLFDGERLPEEFYYYPEKVNVRANWEIKIDIDPEQYDIYRFSEKFRKPISTRKKQ